MKAIGADGNGTVCQDTQGLAHRLVHDIVVDAAGIAAGIEVLQAIAEHFVETVGRRGEHDPAALPRSQGDIPGSVR